jgi:hypothetical protein
MVYALLLLLLLLLLLMMMMVTGALTSLSFDVCAVYCPHAINFPIVIGIVIISTQDGQQDAF